MTIHEKQLIMTRRCALISCSEVIYRDTLDKDTAFELDDELGYYYCSRFCALESLKESHHVRLPEEDMSRELETREGADV